MERIDKIGAHIVVVIQKRSSEGSLRDIIRSKEEVSSQTVCVYFSALLKTLSLREASTCTCYTAKHN